MKITTIGRGTIGGSLARLWTAAGHEVTEIGRDGGNVAGADVVLLATPYGAVADALEQIDGWDKQLVIDATNRLGGEAPPNGHASMAEFVKATVGGPVVKAFNLNFGALFDQAAGAERTPHNIWVGDEEARSVIEQLTRDMGMEPVNGGPLERAETQEGFAFMLIAMIGDLGEGPFFYRFATPARL